MVNIAAGRFNSVPLKYFGDWTDRIAEGELPSAKPERPQGVERNIVVTTWDWSSDKKYLHDLISTDKRNPTVNGYGKLYGSNEYSSDNLPVLDPKTGKVNYITPPEDPSVPEALGPGPCGRSQADGGFSLLGMAQNWDTRFNNHNDMIDAKGRVWMTGTNHAPGTPAFCKAGSDNPYAKVFPIDKNERQLAMFDPKTQKFTFIDTCFGTHHLQFGFDKDNTLWTSGGGELAMLARHQGVRRNRRCPEGAGLGAIRARHRRQRQARRLHHAGPAGRSQQGYGSRRFRHLRGDA